MHACKVIGDTLDVSSSNLALGLTVPDHPADFELSHTGPKTIAHSLSSLAIPPQFYFKWQWVQLKDSISPAGNSAYEMQADMSVFMELMSTAKMENFSILISTAQYPIHASLVSTKHPTWPRWGPHSTHT